MRITLPVTKKTFNEETKEVFSENYELPVTIDTSFLAHLKWEEHFQATLGYDLSHYTSMVQKQIQEDQSKVSLLGLLKLLYCYVHSDKIPTFKEFLTLFDVENTDTILSKIRTVLEQVNSTVSKN